MVSSISCSITYHNSHFFFFHSGTIQNVDIIPIIPRVVAAYMDPVKLTADALEALISTTFINDVDLPTLG